MLEIKDSMTKSDFDKMVKLEDLEYFTSSQLKNFVKESSDQIIKSEGSKEEMYHELAVEVRSLKPIIVWDDNLEKSIYHVRRRQVEWDKTEGDEISKARGGTYLNTPENQKLGRVGQKYGGNGKKEEVSEGDKKEEKNSDGESDGDKEKTPDKSIEHIVNFFEDEDVTEEYGYSVESAAKLYPKLDKVFKKYLGKDFNWDNYVQTGGGGSTARNLISALNKVGKLSEASADLKSTFPKLFKENKK